MLKPAWFIVIIFGISLLPAPVAGQFQMPLPPQLSGPLTCAIKIKEQGPSANTCETDSSKAIAAGWVHDPPQFPYRLYLVRGPSIFCRSKPNTDQGKPKDDHCSDATIRRLYGNKNLDLFSSFASSATKSKIYLASSVLSGLIGRVHFDFSFSQVVVANDTGTTALTRKEVQGATSNIMRLVNNGGSATARILIPLLAGGGSNSQSGIGIYVNGGVVGPLNESDSLLGTVGGAVDALTAFAIRSPTSYSLLAELFLGARAGYQYVGGTDPIVPTLPDRSMPFLQLAAGVREGKIARLSVLYTLVRSPYREFMPRFQVSVQTSGF